MVQFDILAGKRAGTSWVARRFPVRIGRGAEADLLVDDPGVWEKHARVDLRKKEGFWLSPESEAIVTINAEKVNEAKRLRNGDTIEFGGTKLQFWLANARQHGLGVREWLTWIALAAISLSQIALIYFVLN